MAPKTIREQVAPVVPDSDEDIEPPDDAMVADPEEKQENAVSTDTTNQNAKIPWEELLAADTPPEEIHQRAALGKGGAPVMRDGQPLMLDYVTARFVMDRLDAAVGPTNWQTMFETLPGGGSQAVRCGIGIRIPGSEPTEWVWKWDVGTPSSIEPEKGAHSDAFKRAGVHWGIARDLYDTRDEDRLAPVAQTQQQGQVVQQQPVQQQPVQQQMPMGQGQTTIRQYDEDGGPGGAPAWVCPLHDDSKIVPAGVSKRTNRAYNAFYACPVAGCDQKGPSLGGR